MGAKAAVRNTDLGPSSSCSRTSQVLTLDVPTLGKRQSGAVTRLA